MAAWHAGPAAACAGTACACLPDMLATSTCTKHVQSPTCTLVPASSLALSCYRRTYKGGNYISADPNLDWAANLSHMMGFDDPNALELMRLYQTIHSDHEGGNVSAHATHLVGSALSDPYLSFAAGMCGLAGPLHGLANQEVLRWLQDVQAEVRGVWELGGLIPRLIGGVCCLESSILSVSSINVS